LIYAIQKKLLTYKHYWNTGLTVRCCVQKADMELANIDKKMSKLEQLRLELAEFFCEDTKMFRLDDCIKTFHEFFEKFHKATQVCTVDLSTSILWSVQCIIHQSSPLYYSLNQTLRLHFTRTNRTLMYKYC